MNENTGKLVLRLVLGITLVLHGIHKLVAGVDPIAGMLANAGLPEALKYGPYVGEFLAPLAVIAGFYSRIGAWLIAVNMIFALGLAHTGQLFALDPQSGALVIEKQYLFLFTAVALALIGPGRYAVNQK